jgi:predicted amidohydrolase
MSCGLFTPAAITAIRQSGNVFAPSSIGDRIEHASKVAELMETLSAALWATNLEVPGSSLQDWAAFLDARMQELQAAGFRLLVLPEVACAQWLSFAPVDLALSEQVAWLASMTDEALRLVRPLAARHGVALLPGTMPYRIAGSSAQATRYVNRAWLFLPDGREFTQDKLCLTPSEQNPEGWNLSPGSQVNVIEWEGLRLAIVICLDVEFTSLWARLGKLDLDLVIVPAKTDMVSGYNRVFGCAFARATELQTVVCAVGAIGSPMGIASLDTVMGGAAVFVPCDSALGLTGVAAALEPHAAASGLSPMLYAPDMPVGYCRRMRQGAAEAEVWPASWTADHVRVVDPAKSVQQT